MGQLSARDGYSRVMRRGKGEGGLMHKSPMLLSRLSAIMLYTTSIRKRPSETWLISIYDNDNNSNNRSNQPKKEPTKSTWPTVLFLLVALVALVVSSGHVNDQAIEPSNHPTIHPFRYQSINQFINQHSVLQSNQVGKIKKSSQRDRPLIAFRPGWRDGWMGLGLSRLIKA